MIVKDCTIGENNVVVEENLINGRGGLVAHAAGDGEGGRRFATRRYEVEIDNRVIRHIGRGRVVRRIPATRTLPPRCDVELD